MKRIAGLLTIVLSALSVVSCDENKVQTQKDSPVVIYQGSVELSDKKFGLYYGDKYSNEIGVYYVVLSDAMCFRNGYGSPYMDSEGDMLVLEFHGPVAANESEPRLPAGTYTIGEPVADGYRVNPEGYNSDTDNINGVTNWWWGRNDDLEIRDATKNWDAIDAMYAEYDAKKIDYPYGQFVPEVDEIQAKIQNINEVYTNYTKMISFGKYNGTAEEIVAEMQAAMKQAGIEEVTAALQAQFDALYK